MNKWELFQKFIVTQQEKVEVVDFLINSILIILIAFLLELTYRKCGKSLSNRKSFAHPFILIGFATMLIISVVKSSLALSLGLVGALSIVRFRAAIKEPEELAYLFLLISFGLGLGANLRFITIIAFAVIEAVILVKFLTSKKQSVSNLFLTISTTENNFSIENISNIVSKHFKKFELKRFNQTNNLFESVYLIEAKNISSIENFTNEIKLLSDQINISYIDNKIV